MARCQSDNDLQAVTQHKGEHSGPWTACKKDGFFFKIKHKQHTKQSIHTVMGVTELSTSLLS